jgi:hypothetical protein
MVKMETSETIGKIAEALSKAQSSMTGAKKASANPFFKSKYSDLSQVMEAISAPFADNGLSFVQSPGFDGERITVTTRIMHTSGEWIEGTTVLPPTKNDAQGYGSAITYAKRYGLQAMAGVPSVDDDGNDAVKHSAPRVNKRQVQQYVQAFVDAIEAEDGLAMRQMGDELKDTPEHDAVWKQLDTKQKEAVKRIIRETIQAEKEETNNG